MQNQVQPSTSMAGAGATPMPPQPRTQLEETREEFLRLTDRINTLTSTVAGASDMLIGASDEVDGVGPAAPVSPGIVGGLQCAADTAHNAFNVLDAQVQRLLGGL